MNLRKEFQEIAKLIDELREYMEVKQPTFLEGKGITRGKEIDMTKAVTWK